MIIESTKFEQFIKERSLLHNVSVATAEWHRQSLRWLAVEQPTQEDLNNFIFRMRKANLSPASVNNRIRSVNAYLHWLLAGEGKCGSGCRHLRCSKLKEPQNVMPTYTPAQVKLLIEWKPAHRNFYQRRLSLLVSLLFDCGLRISECLQMKVCDVDMDSMLVLVQGKGSRQRRVPFSFELRKRLFRFVQDFEIQPTCLLFCTRDYTKMDKNICRRDVRQLCRDLGFEPPARVLHSFRHSFATSYLQRGGNALMLQRLLGHSTLTMTSRYVHFQTADLSAVHERLSLLG
jgi:integrase/recombinase XerD